MKKIVTFGGGGGQAQILCGLREFANLQITAVCTASDDGRSTGRLVREYGECGVYGFLGDVSKCMWGLSAKTELNNVMVLRFDSGSLAPHSVKNVVFAGLIAQYGARRAVELLHQLFGLPTHHRVMPCTFERCGLQVLMGDKWISEETYVDEIWRNPFWDPRHHPVNDIRLLPQVDADPQVIKAVNAADAIVICPGDTYTSVIPSLLPTGIKRVISRCRARIFMVINLMTKVGETDGYVLQDFVRQVTARIGRIPDKIICNSGHIPEDLLVRYLQAEHKVAMVAADADSLNGLRGRVVLADIWANDASRVIHDSRKTAQVLYELINQ